MVNLFLLNFIVFNFLQVPLRSVVIFNCWQMEMQHIFSEMANINYVYAQYVNLDKSNLTTNFEHRFFKHKRPTLGVFLDMNCKNSLDVLKESSNLGLFNEHYHWLIYDEKTNMANFQQFFLNANLSVDADLTYVSFNAKKLNLNKTSASYILYDVYSNGYALGGKLNMTKDREITCNASNCRLEKYLSELHLRSKYGNRERLPDITMRVGTVITKIPLSSPRAELMEFLISVKDPHVDTIARFGWKLTMLVQDVLGCNMTFTYYNSWSSGSEWEGGIVGALVTKKADFISSPVLNTLTRLKHLAVIAETGGFRSICLFRTPRNSGMHGGVFLQPFSTSVWLIFGLSLGISAVFLWSTFFVEHHRMRQRVKFEPSLLATCLISFGSACIQGSYLIPSSVGGRMAFFTLSLISFIMYNYYTSIVVSSLLGSPVKSNIKTLSQLADSSLDVGLEPLPFTFVYLNSSQQPDVRRFVKRKIDSKKNPSSVWMPVEEGIKKVREKPGFVFVFEASSGFSLVEKLYKPDEICDLNNIMLRTDKSLYTQLHKNSTYKEIIRLKEVRMLESGVYQKHHRYWVRTHLNCFANSFVIDVGMEYCAPLFFMICSAYILVGLILIIEIGLKRYVDKKLARLNAAREHD